jgi:hypothetical protein
MFRIALIAGAAMALSLPVIADEVKSREPEVCQENAAEPQDENMRWRWRAYRHLDCVLALVDRALEEGRGGEDGTVTISRDELERIRTMAFWGKDAAARIGR